MATCCHYPASNIRLLHTPTTCNSYYNARLLQLLQWHQTLMLLRAKGTLRQNFFTLAHVPHDWKPLQGHTLVNERPPKSSSCAGAETAGCSARGERRAAGDFLGAGSAGSSPVKACPTTPSQEAEQIWGGCPGAAPNPEYLASSWQQAGEPRPHVCTLLI